MSFDRITNLTNDYWINSFCRKLGQADLLILDEVGYVPTGKRASELLFLVMSNCYKRQSIIVTSNLELGRWNEIFGNDRLIAALIDSGIQWRKPQV